METSLISGTFSRIQGSSLSKIAGIRATADLYFAGEPMAAVNDKLIQLRLSFVCAPPAVLPDIGKGTNNPRTAAYRDFSFFRRCRIPDAAAAERGAPAVP